MTGYLKIPFAPDMREAILRGRKRKTSRARKFAPNGHFLVEGRTFKITEVWSMSLGMVRDLFFYDEGFESPTEFEKRWRQLHRGHFNENKTVFLHSFSEVHLSGTLT